MDTNFLVITSTIRAPPIIVKWLWLWREGGVAALEDQVREFSGRHTPTADEMNAVNEVLKIKSPCSPMTSYILPRQLLDLRRQLWWRHLPLIPFGIFHQSRPRRNIRHFRVRSIIWASDVLQWSRRWYVQIQGLCHVISWPLHRPSKPITTMPSTMLKETVRQMSTWANGLAVYWTWPIIHRHRVITSDSINDTASVRHRPFWPKYNRENRLRL